MLNSSNFSLSEVSQALTETTHTASKQLPSIKDHPLDWATFKPDYDQAVRQLRILGIDDREQVYVRALQTKGFEQVPARKNNYTLQEIADGKYSQSDRLGRYFVVNRGGQSAKEITDCRAIFFEHDDLPKDEQVKLWCKHGLPDPTFQVETRNSIHSYWVFDQPIEPKLWSPLIDDLVALVGSDASVKDLPRVLRLAGYWDHSFGKDGSPRDSLQVKLINVTAAKYSYEELRAIIPMPQTTIKPPITLPYSQAQTRVDQPIPLSRLISKKHQEIVAYGVCEGSRNASLAALARDLIGAESEALSTGLQFTETARELFDRASANCKPQLESKELESIWRSAEKGSPTPCLDSESWGNVLSAWHKSLTHIESSDDMPLYRLPSIPKEYTELHKIQETWDYNEYVVTDKKGQPIIDPVTGQPKMRRVKIEKSRKSALLNFFDWMESNVNPKVNIRTMEVEFLGKPVKIEGLHAKLQKEDQLEVEPKIIERSLQGLQAMKEYHYDPVKDWLVGLHSDKNNDRNFNWKGISTRLFGTDPNSKFLHLYDEYIRLFFLGSVYRTFEPSHKFDQCLILYSQEQGRGKSTFFEEGLPSEFVTLVNRAKGLDHTDTLTACHRGMWALSNEIDIILSASKRHEGSDLKDSISTRSDLLRIPYARAHEKFERKFLFCGTTNKVDPFYDATGNRRFWVVPVEKTIDLADYKALLPTLWASSVESYFQKVTSEFSPSLYRLGEENIKQFTQSDPWEPYLLEGLGTTEQITIRQCFEIIEQKTNKPINYDAKSQHRIRDILINIGFMKTPQRASKAQGQQYVWQREQTTAELIEGILESELPRELIAQTKPQQQTEQQTQEPRVEPQQQHSKPFEHQYPENIKPLPKDWTEPDPRESMVETQSMPQTEQRQSMPVTSSKYPKGYDSHDKDKFDAILGDIAQGLTREVIFEKHRGYLALSGIISDAFEQATSQASTLG